MKTILGAILAALIGLVPATAQTAKPSVAFEGTRCDGDCPLAEPAVYACVARTVLADPAAHGRYVEALQRLERDPDSENGKRLARELERDRSCGAAERRLRTAQLRAATDGTPFLGRQVEGTGVLVRDLNNNVRLQYPDGSYPWIIDPAGLDQALVGSPVALTGTTIGVRRLRVASVRRVAATAELMAPTQTGDFIWCRSISKDARAPVYASAVFAGDYGQVNAIAAAFAAHLKSKYRFSSPLNPACMFEPDVHRATMRLRSSNQETRTPPLAREVIETGWRYER